MSCRRYFFELGGKVKFSHMRPVLFVRGWVEACSDASHILDDGVKNYETITGLFAD